MKPENLLIDEVKECARNSRTHSSDQVAQIAKSIEEFGWTNPLIIGDDNGLIAGHGRLAAAKLLGLKTVPCLRLSGLSDAQKRAYVIADNKLALNAEWDKEILSLELAYLKNQGFDTSLIGFSEHELLELVFISKDKQSKALEININDFELNHQCPKCGFEFNVKT